MPEPQYAPNHTIDPETGFLESNAYLTAFDGERKKTFIKRLVANGLSLYDTCDELGLSHHTVFKHYHNDPVFKEAVDEARRDYADRLDGVSKRNAMNPKSVIERIFQLKSLFPEKYADAKSSGGTQITVNIDTKTLEMIKKRTEIIDAEPISSTQDISLDNQALTSAKNSESATENRDKSENADDQRI